MKKSVVISVNENPEYLYYLPLTVWAWNKFGWSVICFFEGARLGQVVEDAIANNNHYPGNGFILHKLDPIEGYDSATITQVSRMYAGWNHLEEDFIMMSDSDMLPLSNYWEPDVNKINLWGWNLTEFQQMPMCFCGMSPVNWLTFMMITYSNHNMMIKRDLKLYPQAKGNDPVTRWNVDQQILTDRLHSTRIDKINIHRGVYPNGYPVGRVDRSAWTLDHEVLIDCHMERGIWTDPAKQARLKELLTLVWPNENFDWFWEYTNKFAKLF